jgi:multiple sugar transport system substrate-binding protein
VRLGKTASVAALALLTTAMLAGCGGGSASSGSSPTTLTYWASDQGTSIANDNQVLAPELAAFQKQTGIKVNMEVIPWSDLLNRILAAATSGQGPDVLNIGNTWSASLQATGAFLPFSADLLNQVGGKSQFLSLGSTGAAGQDPVGVPIYGNAYGLYYNKKMFAAAGITSPPTTWDQLISDGQKLTTPAHWGLSVEGGSDSENAHMAFIFGQQHGAQLFAKDGTTPQFNSDAEVAGVEQYLNLMAQSKIVNPSDAEYSNGTEALQDFASGKTAMVMWQGSDGSLKTDGMSTSDYGLAPIPLPAGGANQINSMIAGINISIFKNTKNQAGAVKFVKFMTSAPVQEDLNAAYGSLPTVKAAYSDPAFQTDTDKVLQQVLANTSAPLPQVAKESQFETLVGEQMKTLFADAASGKAINDATVKAALTTANQQMAASG